MNKCNCTAGQVASPQRYNQATNCGPDDGLCGLRTIVIPKAKGSDAEGQPFAPQLGSNRNAIVIYAATGAIYIYDNNGVFTNFTGSSITPVLDALTQQVEASNELVNTMDGKLTAEIANRISADQLLQSTIDSLQAALSTETATRSSNVQALQSALNDLKAQVNAMAGSDTEREERIAADQELQDQIDALQTATENVVTTNDLKTINGQSIIGQGDIELDIPGLNIVQETGDSETEVMSQKAVTDALAAAGAGITSATLTGNDTDNQLTVSTSGPTPDSSSVSLKTVNGQSLIGTGDIPVSGGGPNTTVPCYGGVYTVGAGGTTIGHTLVTVLEVPNVPGGTYLLSVSGRLTVGEGSTATSLRYNIKSNDWTEVGTVSASSGTTRISITNHRTIRASGTVSIQLQAEQTGSEAQLLSGDNVAFSLLPLDTAHWVTSS